MKHTTVFIISLLCFPIRTGVFSKHTKLVKAQENCGHPYGMISGKIVGGYDVGYYKYPWFVSLYKDNIPYCGSTLVTKKSVVTAAHCFQQYLNNPKGIENEYELRMGTYNICNTHEATLKTYKAKKVYIHEKYASEDPFFDIALIVLGQEVAFEPACLPIKPYNSNERPKEAFIAGYGVLRYQDYKTSCILREARIRIYSDKECKKMLKKIDPEIDNFANAFCAGYLEGGVDACQGDSGGPLMVLQSGSRLALLGLTSFGYKCAEKNLLGIYTDISKFLDWIQEKTNAPIAGNPGDNGGESEEDEGDEDEDQGDDDSDENDEGDEDDGDDDEDSDDDGDKKKRKSKRVGNETSVGHHRKYGEDRKHHHNKKSLRTKTVFEIKRMNKKRHKADSKRSKNHSS